MSCPDRHTRDDERLGQPLCPDCYDYTGSVLFNACAPELWRRFTITLRRTLARRAGMTNKALAAQLRVSFAKVAEYQRRGVVHFHAIIRLDGPTGPGSAPPAWATVALLTAAIAQAASAVHLQTPAAARLPARTLAWGREHDTRPITTTGDLTDIRVAAYVAKYATKAAECTGALDRRITATDRLDELPVSERARRLIATCFRLGKLPELADLRLAAWAHMLGFRGHFSTKSRHYSTTFGALRAERAQHQRDHSPTGSLWPEPEDDTTLVIAHWRFAGQGHPPRLRCPETSSDLVPHRRRGGAGCDPALLTVPRRPSALAISRSKLYELLASGAVASIRIDGLAASRSPPWRRTSPGPHRRDSGMTSDAVGPALPTSQTAEDQPR